VLPSADVLELCERVLAGFLAGLAAGPIGENPDRPGLWLAQIRNVRGSVDATKGAQTVIASRLLDILICPENHTRLKLADEGLIERLNAAIRAGELRNRSGDPVTSALNGGLVREDGRILYPIIDDIPIMLVDEAIPLDPPAV